MKFTKLFFLKVLPISFGLILLIFIFITLWLYQGGLTPLKQKIFKTVPYPMAFVNGKPVLMKEYILRYESAQKILDTENAKNLNQKYDFKNTIISQILNEEKIFQIAKKYYIEVSPNEIQLEFNNEANQAEIRDKYTFTELLAQYGLTESLYKSYVLKPRLTRINLQIWFNSQKDLNTATYQLAENLAFKIKNGQKMTALAENFSEDLTGQSIGGDLGFVNPTEILWELKEPVLTMKIGDIKTIPSRAGVHIIQLEETDGNLLHLRQIFLKTQDFDLWLNNQTNNFPTKLLFN